MGGQYGLIWENAVPLGVILASFYLLPLLIKDTGSAMSILLEAIPFICFICSITYGAKRGLNILYPSLEGVILVTFGDMMKLKGTHFSLSDKQGQGSKIIVVYSPEDALTIAAKNRDKSVVFIAVGFGTTAPLIAMTVKLAVCGTINDLATAGAIPLFLSIGFIMV